ncbi:hypothetical protein [Absidia glauca]|uniref:Uncharacterized protein n=1 Tax=Absidia glauca TaxID=4829 RepID=A0A168RB13_ABSGL|nr:hypothetical protein [Absidia glauca]
MITTINNFAQQHNITIETSANVAEERCSRLNKSLYYLAEHNDHIFEYTINKLHFATFQSYDLSFAHSRFQTPIGLQELFFCPSIIFAPSSPRHYFLCLHCHSLHSTPTNERTNERTSKRTNEQTNERANERTNERTVTLTFSRRCLSFAYHYQLFAFCIAPLSFDTRSATAMTTTIDHDDDSVAIALSKDTITWLTPFGHYY